MPVRRMAARIIPAGEGGYICCRYSAFACAAVWAAMYPNVSAGPILMQRYMGFTQNAKLKGQSFGAQRLVRAEALQPYGVRGQEQAPETQKAVSGTCGRLNRPYPPCNASSRRCRDGFGVRWLEVWRPAGRQTPVHAYSALVSSGTTVNRSPTRP